MKSSQIQLSKKQKNFYQFFALFLKVKSNFERFLKNDSRHTFCISEITDCKIRR